MFHAQLIWCVCELIWNPTIHSQRMKLLKVGCLLMFTLQESRMKQQQLESIFKLMMADQEKFGVSNKDDIAEQMKLYAI